MLFSSLLFAVGLVAVVIGFRSSDTDAGQKNLPKLVEQIDPVAGAVRVPSQTRVFVDLAAGYTGVLIVDGKELETVDIGSVATVPRGQQLSLPPKVIYEPGNATLSFVPTKGAVIEDFAEGRHDVTVVYWELTEGRSTSRQYSWTFNVF